MGIKLPSARISAGELLQHVSRVIYSGDPVYFGREGMNRYDAPARDYGVNYLGRDLATALMESVFHKHNWDKDEKRSIGLMEVRSRLVRVIGVVEDLNLADLTADGVMAGCFGLNLEQLAGRDYSVTQKLSAQIYAMLGEDGMPLVDGVLYPSRNNYPASTIALFDRARRKIKVICDIDLPDHNDWAPFVKNYNVGVV